jgi:hypothetical protein
VLSASEVDVSKGRVQQRSAVLSIAGANRKRYRQQQDQ